MSDDNLAALKQRFAHAFDNDFRLGTLGKQDLLTLALDHLRYRRLVEEQLLTITRLQASVAANAANSGTQWAICSCGVPIFAQPLWSHQGGTVESGDHDIEPQPNSEWREPFE